MDIIINGKGISVTPSMKTYIESKLSKLPHFWNELIRCHVEVSRNQHHKHGDVYATYAWIESPGKDIRATAEGTEFQEAVNVLYGTLERAVVKAKERVTRA